MHAGIPGQGGFLRIPGRHDQVAPRPGGGQSGGQHALDGTQGPGEGQLAEQFVGFQGVAGQLARSGENANGDGQIKAATLLGQIRRRQVHGDASAGKFEMGIEQGAAYPILAFLHRRFR